MKLPVGPPRHKVLLIDDEEVSRYLLRQLLPESCSVIEANTGARGIESARSNSPEIIFLDLNMPEMTGFEVLRQLKGDPATRFIPIVIVTSQRLTEQDRQLLIPQTVAIISKETLARAESIRVDFGPVFGVSVEGEAQGPFRMAESLQ
jgi:CheY-like chemotaxis protein